MHKSKIKIRLTDFHRFNDIVINMPRPHFNPSFNEYLLLSELLVRIVGYSRDIQKGITLREVFHILIKYYKTNLDILNKLPNLKDAIREKRERSFRQWMGYCAVLGLIESINGKYIISQITYRIRKLYNSGKLANIIGIYQDTIYNFPVYGPYISKLRSSGYFRNMNYRLGASILKYLLKINRKATTFELSIFFGKPDARLQTEESIIANAINMGRDMPIEQKDQIDFYFKYKGWLDNKGHNFIYKSSEQPYFKFKFFLLLMKAACFLKNRDNLWYISKEEFPKKYSDILPLEEINNFDDLIKQEELEEDKATKDIEQEVAKGTSLHKIIKKECNKVMREKPQWIRSNVKRLKRHPKIYEVLKRINGYKCQACGLSPFIKENKQGYLEPHHILAYNEKEGGPNIEENLLVLCPNCHRKLHSAMKKTIIATYKLLRRKKHITINQFEKLIDLVGLSKKQISTLENKGVISRFEKYYLINKI